MSRTNGIDPRTPVIAGVGQINHEGGDAPEPVELLAMAARRAASDSGAPALLDQVQSVRVVQILSRGYPDPGALVAARVAPHARHTLLSGPGGNMPQVLIDRTVADIAAGRLDAAIVGGAESWKTWGAYRGRGEHAPWTRQEGAQPSERVGGDLTVGDPEEAAVGVVAPVQYYPLFENALRAKARRSLKEHAVRIAELWSRFSTVAAHNPSAAIRRAHTAEEIGTPTPLNRMIAFPYTKLLCSNASVDQAAALLICSAQVAADIGVPRERWVFLHGAAEAADAGVSYREDLTESPAIRVVGRAAMDAAGVGKDDLAFIDLYSCFPAAVQVAATELGLSLERQLTITGGLTFAGGPWNNYVTHSVATMIALLREAPSAIGLCTANGGMLSKHAAGIYSARPPRVLAPLREVQPEVDGFPRCSVAEDYQGPATVETYTVAHDRHGESERAFVVARVPDGRRAWASSTEPSLLDTLERQEGCGLAAVFDHRSVRLA